MTRGPTRGSTKHHGNSRKSVSQSVLHDLRITELTSKKKGPYNKSLVGNGEGDHLYLLEGDLGVPKVSPQLSPLSTATPAGQDNQDETQITLLKSTPTHITSNHQHTTTTTTTTTSLLLAGEENEEQEGQENVEGKRKDGDGGKEKKGRKRKITTDTTTDSAGHPKRIRDLVAFWLLGFCNNFTYWVMITAAYDLLTVQSQT
ncbi:hypothetical protein Pmani_037089 [Petrolisthes manimaculis]|nr:hypothetical protein Pmani_037089 [Petrolisthes manimaculis]